MYVPHVKLKKNKNLARRTLFLLFVVLLLQISTACKSKFFEKICLKALENLGNIAKKTKPAEILNCSSAKLLSKDMSQFIGNFLKPKTAQKMMQINKRFSDVKIYENISPSERDIPVHRNIYTGEIMWKMSKCRTMGFWEKIMSRETALPNQEQLVSHLRRKDVKKWNEVFLWIARNNLELNKSQNASFLKELMLEVAQNVPVTLFGWFGYSPLHIAAEFDDADSIRTLISRKADVNQPNYFGWTALHVSAAHGNKNACVALIDGGTDVNVAAFAGWTPLMRVRSQDMFNFLISKGAQKDLTTNKGQTVAELTGFQR